MEVSTKELRIQPGKIIDQVVQGVEVTVTFRGKALAKIVPLGAEVSTIDDPEADIFGMWSNHSSATSVDDMVRPLRQGREF